MYPSKNTLEYMNAINRLFSRNNEFDLHSPSNSFQSIVPSSSSTETSPESYPDLTTRPELLRRQDERDLFEFRHERQYNYEHRRDSFESRSEDTFETRSDTFEGRSEDHHHQEFTDTPFIIHSRRAIKGRKIMASTETLPKIQETSTIWQPTELASQTPPKTNNYELFPLENKGFGFQTPVKISPKYSISPIQVSPNFISSPVQVSPNFAPSPKLMRSPQVPMHSHRPQQFNELIASTSQGNQPSCSFCKKNGETPLVYMGHNVKEKYGNKNIVTCPILRRHVCSTCGASGDNAHTITYCPILRSSNNGQPLRSTTITLKNTRVKSNGRRRY